ncbi:galactose oxidase [Larkinella insperata]|uniref:Galactose oxidase n=1 Tax=Larkinella insperata TaxID=332158 RepID=A0ABW3Q480_9BACT|nr:galactose oxidase [Larkinella insperata]
MRFWIALILFFLLVVSGLQNSAYAQVYGLGFTSYEVVQDKRTGLELNPEKPFCLSDDFEISFEMSFLADRKNYFGYVVRLIENDTRNIDILYDNSDAVTHHFKVVVGDRFSTIAFNIPEADLFQKWNKIRLVFNKKQKTISLISGSQRFRYPFEPAHKGCYKILFGATRYKNFSTTDVPPMKIRNIQLLENGEPRHHWPLDEMQGTKTVDILGHREAQATNPLWIKKMHYDWHPLKTVVMPGPARITGDPTTGTVYVVGQDSLVSYRVATDQVQRNGYPAQHLFMDNQVLFEKSLNKIFNIHINEKQVTAFDLETRQWNRSVADSSLKTHFLHANKFYAPRDSSLYMLGGYGHLEYKDRIQKYDLRTGTWSILPNKDTLFTPRYLAALGRVQGGAYLLGGYGSPTGKQLLNPRHGYDLLYFNTKEGTFRRIYRLDLPEDDFVFANSMVVNEKDSSFYALVFPKDKFSTELQLIRGSLVKPQYSRVGSSIPFQFVDTSSFADLFFDNHTNRFVAITSSRTDRNQTRVSIYSLFAPPLRTAPEPTRQARSLGPKMGIALTGLVALLALLVYFQRKRGSKVTPTALAPVSEPVRALTAEPATPAPSLSVKPLPAQNCILLFGNLQIFDAQGTEITKALTPLLKELFLVLLLYSTRSEGISSEKLIELLWFDKNAESARNNRSVNIAKLKAILDKLEHCEISKETGYWRLNIDSSSIRVDYRDYLRLISAHQTLTKQEVTELASIIKRGSFLANQEYEWLDPFKSEISNEVVNTYLRYASSVSISDDPEFLIQLANYIFYFDPVNEEAMIIKCKALAFLGKHSLAKTALETFSREYSRIYGEEFRKDMPEVLHS